MPQRALSFSRRLFFLMVMMMFSAAVPGLMSIAQAAPSSQATPPPETVTIPGTIQSKAGCPGDWQPDCAKTFLTYDPASDVWSGAFQLPAGDYEYKVAINKSWSENYGLKAAQGGANIPLHLAGPTLVHFYYDHKTHWVTDSVNSVIATAVGTFQSELGCKKDNDPACLRTWLEDPEGTGIYSVTTRGIPAGDYEVKIALGESMQQTYAPDGTPNGPATKFTVAASGSEVYFGYDPATHKTTISTEGAPKGNLSKFQAYWVTRDAIVWNVIGSPKYSYELFYDPNGALKLEVGKISGGKSLPLHFDKAGPGKATFDKFPQLLGFSTLKLDPQDVALVPDILKGQAAVTVRDDQGKLLDATSLQIPGVLDDLYTYAGPLGTAVENGVPVLRLWAPTARAVTLQLFPDSKAESMPVAYPLSPEGQTGVWKVTGTRDWLGQYYLYDLQVYVPREGKVLTNHVTDPYSLSLSTNSLRSQVVNLDSPALKPGDWDVLTKPPLAAPENSVIYELHVRDFSAMDESIPQALRGTFKAFTLPNSSGMLHLKELAAAGLTTIHLLPAFDFASVDEDKSTWQSPDTQKMAVMPPDSDQQQAEVAKTVNLDAFNWGYDPFHYTAPEGSYATNPDGTARILEFREMVQSINQAGLRVVMDVVYNHTNASGEDPKSVLDQVVPMYYHRLNADGTVENSTCCQNTATEHAMMEKLMVDSVVTWAKEYKVDGFRFDLMGHHMLHNMVAVRQALDALTVDKDGVDGKQIYVYGEGWDFGEVANNARGKNASQLNIGGSGIGVFNDRLRDGARGGNPFGPVTDQGFLTGLVDAPNATEKRTPAEQSATLLHTTDWIRAGLAGNLADFVFQAADGKPARTSDIDYGGKPTGYTRDPQENILYVSAHDNETLWDAIQEKAPASASLADRVRMQNMGFDLVLLGQGVPFIHAGDELLRSKSLDRNSYNSGDWFNHLDFTGQGDNWGVGLPPAGDNKANWPLMQSLLADPVLKPGPAEIQSANLHFEEMLQIRKSTRLFRMQTSQEVIDRLKFYNTSPGQLHSLIVMRLDGAGLPAAENPFGQVVVLFNAAAKPQTFTSADFKSGGFSLHPIQAASSDPALKSAVFDSASGAFTVPGRTTAVFVSKPPAASPGQVSLPAVSAGNPTPQPSGESIHLPVVNSETTGPVAPASHPVPGWLNAPLLPWAMLAIVAILAAGLAFWRGRVR